MPRMTYGRYSSRSAFQGSIREARHAGPYPAGQRRSNRRGWPGSWRAMGDNYRNFDLNTATGYRHQVSLTAGTNLHNTKTPLTVWLWAAYVT